MIETLTKVRFWQGLALVMMLTSTPLMAADDEVIQVGKSEKISLSRVTTLRPALLLVLSHHTLALAEELPRAWIADGTLFPSPRVITLMAAAKAPWAVRHLFIPGHMDTAKEERERQLSPRIPDLAQSPILLDVSGEAATRVGADDLGTRGWAALILEKDGITTPLLRGEVGEKEDLPALAGRIASAAKKLIQ